jgi:hypothetical protein
MILLCIDCVYYLHDTNYCIKNNTYDIDICISKMIKDCSDDDKVFRFCFDKITKTEIGHKGN